MLHLRNPKEGGDDEDNTQDELDDGDDGVRIG